MEPVKIHFSFRNETKTCYRFETGEKPDQMTIYLKKHMLDDNGIDPKKGITISIEEDNQ